MSTALVLFHRSDSNGSEMSPISMLSTPVDCLISSICMMLELCKLIRENRNTGPVTNALDNLQETLDGSKRLLLNTVMGMHNDYGSTLDDRTDPALDVIYRCIDQVDHELLPKMEKIAFRTKSNNGRGLQFEHPHFGEITKRFKQVDNVIHASLQSICHRVEKEKSESHTPPPILERAQTPIKSDEKVVKVKEMESLTDHIKNSWFEKISGGEIIFISCFDDSVSRRDRPENAFIRALPQSETWTDPSIAEREREIRRLEETLATLHDLERRNQVADVQRRIDEEEDHRRYMQGYYRMRAREEEEDAQRRIDETERQRRREQEIREEEEERARRAAIRRDEEERENWGRRKSTDPYWYSPGIRF